MNQKLLTSSEIVLHGVPLTPKKGFFFLLQNKVQLFCRHIYKKSFIDHCGICLCFLMYCANINLILFERKELNQKIRLLFFFSDNNSTWCFSWSYYVLNTLFEFDLFQLFCFKQIRITSQKSWKKNNPKILKIYKVANDIFSSFQFLFLNFWKL